MAQLGNVIHVRTDKDSHFTGAIAQNAGEFEHIGLPQGIAAGRHCRSRVHAIVIISDQNLAWEVVLFGSTVGNASDLDLNRLISRWSFTAGDAVQIGATGPYLYYIFGNDQHYEDFDCLGQLHIMLVNRSVTAKDAGATGEVVVDLAMEPTNG